MIGSGLHQPDPSTFRSGIEPAIACAGPVAGDRRLIDDGAPAALGKDAIQGRDKRSMTFR